MFVCSLFRQYLRGYAFIDFIFRFSLETFEFGAFTFSALILEVAGTARCTPWAVRRPQELETEYLRLCATFSLRSGLHIFPTSLLPVIIHIIYIHWRNFEWIFWKLIAALLLTFILIALNELACPLPIILFFLLNYVLYY